MRIVGGQWRGRQIHSPSGRATRPTSDRVRESVFNILHHARWCQKDVVSGACVLDAFAGTGALGFESLSRGAAQAVFMEKDRQAQTVCLQNIAHFDVADKTTLVRGDACLPPALPASCAAASLVFLDPPYGKGMGVAALAALDARGWIAPQAVCVMEMAKKTPEALPAGWTVADERGYGIALVRFLVRG